MPTREEILREKTHKDGATYLETRVYDTLMDSKGHETHRIAKALALTIKFLVDECGLRPKDVDDILFEVVR